MIFGDCPYCDEFLTSDVDPAGTWSKETCNHCKREHWVYRSRIEPFRITLEEFNKKYIIKNNIVEKIKED